MSDVAPAEISRTLREEFAQLLGCPPEEVDLSRRVTALPGMDSLRLVQAVVACEKRFGIELSEDDLFDVRTGEDLALLIERTSAARGGA